MKTIKYYLRFNRMLNKLGKKWNFNAYFTQLTAQNCQKLFYNG